MEGPQRIHLAFLVLFLYLLNLRFPKAEYFLIRFFQNQMRFRKKYGKPLLFAGKSGFLICRKGFSHVILVFLLRILLSLCLATVAPPLAAFLVPVSNEAALARIFFS